MKKTIQTIAVALCALGTTVLTSCFKDEPLNAECDIESVAVHVPQPTQAFFNLSDTLQNVQSADSVITFSVRSGADLSAARLDIATTSGAKLEQTGGGQPQVGGEVRYKVSSEDGNWRRYYTIRFVPVTHTVNDTIKFDFEHFELEPRAGAYYIWHNVMPDGTLGNDWATGNPGFQLSRGSAKPNEYPTVPLAEGYDGTGIKLITRDTGAFGVIANMRLAAGNFFLGTFDVGSALKDAMKATRFGISFDKKPVKFTGYYKYAPGEKYQDRSGKKVDGVVDEGSIYAVLYRNHDSQGNAVVLDGNDVLTSPQIVAIAKVPKVDATTGWTAFEVAFDYSEGINSELLASRGYNLAVVFSSSVKGDQFQGAVGSELCVDKVRVICATEE